MTGPGRPGLATSPSLVITRGARIAACRRNVARRCAMSAPGPAVSCWPAKDAWERSSAVALEGTAQARSGPAVPSAPATARRTGFGNGTLPMWSRTSAARAASRPRAAPACTSAAYAAVVTTNPSGTGNPPCRSLARFAPLPPTIPGSPPARRGRRPRARRSHGPRSCPVARAPASWTGPCAYSPASAARPSFSRARACLENRRSSSEDSVRSVGIRGGG